MKAGQTMQETTVEVNQKIWEEIYSNKQNILKYPCEDLVTVFNRVQNRKEAPGMKCLDIGFGPGNNLEFLATQGMDCYGIEVSTSAQSITKERLESLGLKAKLDLTEDNTLPYPDNFFDMVVAWHVLSYNDETSLKKALSEIKRVLKPNGKFLSAFSTYEQIMVAEGTMIREGIFKYTENKSNQDGVILIAAKEEDDVKKLFGTFKEIEIGLSVISFSKITNSHWLIYARK